jgi:hypothetical protein
LHTGGVTMACLLRQPSSIFEEPTGVIVLDFSEPSGWKEFFSAREELAAALWDGWADLPNLAGGFGNCFVWPYGSKSWDAALEVPW